MRASWTAAATARCRIFKIEPPEYQCRRLRPEAGLLPKMSLFVQFHKEGASFSCRTQIFNAFRGFLNFSSRSGNFSSRQISSWDS
jgi:hypothetical protein